MKTSIKTLSVIAGIVLLASCSKSLTDIGYETSSVETTDPTTVGGHIDSYGNLCGPRPMRRYEEPYWGSMAESLNAFYKGLLSAKFDAAKFAKKNKNFLADNIKEEIQRYSDSAYPKAPLYGWQIFMGKDFGTETSYSVSHYDGNWYQIGVEGCKLEDNVFVRIDFFGAGHTPKITGISNDYLNVHINDK